MPLQQAAQLVTYLEAVAAGHDGSQVDTLQDTAATGSPVVLHLAAIVTAATSILISVFIPILTFILTFILILILILIFNLLPDRRLPVKRLQHIGPC